MVPQSVGETVVTANYGTEEFGSELTWKPPPTHTHKYWIKCNKTTWHHSCIRKTGRKKFQIPKVRIQSQSESESWRGTAARCVSPGLGSSHPSTCDMKNTASRVAGVRNETWHRAGVLRRSRQTPLTSRVSGDGMKARRQLGQRKDPLWKTKIQARTMHRCGVQICITFSVENTNGEVNVQIGWKSMEPNRGELEPPLRHASITRVPRGNISCWRWAHTEKLHGTWGNKLPRESQVQYGTWLGHLCDPRIT